MHTLNFRFVKNSINDNFSIIDYPQIVNYHPSKLELFITNRTRYFDREKMINKIVQ